MKQLSHTTIRASLIVSVLFLYLAICPYQAEAEEEITCQFEHMWPTFPQPWYNPTVIKKEAML